MEGGLLDFLTITAPTNDSPLHDAFRRIASGDVFLAGLVLDLDSRFITPPRPGSNSEHAKFKAKFVPYGTK